MLSQKDFKKAADVGIPDTRDLVLLRNFGLLPFFKRPQLISLLLSGVCFEDQNVTVPFSMGSLSDGNKNRVCRHTLMWLGPVLAWLNEALVSHREPLPFVAGNPPAVEGRLVLLNSSIDVVRAWEEWISSNLPDVEGEDYKIRWLDTGKHLDELYKRWQSQNKLGKCRKKQDDKDKYLYLEKFRFLDSLFKQYSIAHGLGKLNAWISACVV